MSGSYRQKLLDPRWQKKRLEILERDKWACVNCDDSESTLHVHHKVYLRGREPWEYKDHCYATLCESCHKSAEDLRQEFLEALAQLPVFDLEFMLYQCHERLEKLKKKDERKPRIAKIYA